jgi:uncharacterized protein YqjF (DUF2071 family)
VTHSEQNPPESAPSDYLAAILRTVDHRPYPLPQRPWRMTQRWNDLLFAHWAIPPAALANRLPDGLEVDTFDGQAWLGVIPFWMDRVRVRTLGSHTLSVPTVTTFPELNLRTYVRSKVSGLVGVYFFSLDCASPLAVFGARTLFHLPYFPSTMSRVTTSTAVEYASHRQLTRHSVNYRATYAPLREASNTSRSGARPASGRTCLASFLTERYCLFTSFANRLLIGDIHHRPWPLAPRTRRSRHPRQSNPPGPRLHPPRNTPRPALLSPAPGHPLVAPPRPPPLAIAPICQLRLIATS